LLTHDLFTERFVESSRSWLSRNVQQAPLGRSPSPAAEGDRDAPLRQAVGLTQEEIRGAIRHSDRHPARLGAEPHRTGSPDGKSLVTPRQI
jgi:hypothetical protein